MPETQYLESGHKLRIQYRPYDGRANEDIDLMIFQRVSVFEVEEAVCRTIKGWHANGQPRRPRTKTLAQIIEEDNPLMFYQVDEPDHVFEYNQENEEGE